MVRWPDTERSQLLLIGASRFRANLLGDIEAVDSGIDKLYAVLTDRRTGVFSRDGCQVVKHPQTVRNVVDPFFAASQTANDVLLVYYAGHGVLGRNQKLYLAVEETDPEQPVGNSVDFADIKHALEQSPAPLRILILDCCYSGHAVRYQAAAADTEDIDTLLAQVTDIPDGATDQAVEGVVEGMYVLTSSGSSVRSQFMPGEPTTMFTGALIHALDSAAGADLRVKDIFPRVADEMRRRGGPAPQMAMGNTSGELGIRRGAPSGPGNSPPSERSRWRSTTVLAAVTALVVVLAIVVWIGLSNLLSSGAPAVPSTTASLPTSSTVPPAPASAAVDPCALVDTAQLRPAATLATVREDYGPYNACTVQADPGMVVTISVSEPAATFPRPDDTSETTDDGRWIVTKMCDDEGCAASVVSTGDSDIGVRTTVNGEDGRARWTSVRDAAATMIVIALPAGRTLPLRPHAATTPSITQVPACDLFTAADLGVVPGLSDTAPDAQHGDLGCEWGNSSAPPGQNSRIGLAYGRILPTEHPGCDATGRYRTCVLPAEETGLTTCVASIGGPPYDVADGPRIEELQFRVRADPSLSQDAICTAVRTLAEVAVSRLPQ